MLSILLLKYNPVLIPDYMVKDIISNIIFIIMLREIQLKYAAKCVYE